MIERAKPNLDGLLSITISNVPGVRKELEICGSKSKWAFGTFTHVPAGIYLVSHCDTFRFCVYGDKTYLDSREFCSEFEACLDEAIE